jgi:membrane protease YdiL (CAAX protease family)
MKTVLIHPLITKEQKIVPLLPQKAIWHFLLAGLAVRLAIYHFLPFLTAQGLTPFEAFVVSFIAPLAILFALAFGTVQAEGVPMTAQAFARRFRLRRLTWRQLGWTVLGLAAAVVFSMLLAPTQGWLLRQFPALQPPASFPPLMNPLLQSEQLPVVIITWMGAKAVGNWGYAVLALLLFFFNIFGEELYWRGVLLPRQELVHGRHTWLVHGLMWNLFHLPIYPWYLVYGLPITLVTSFIAQKTGNTWTAIILHGLANVTMYALMIGVVAGAI